MNETKVEQYLKKYNMEDRIINLKDSSATVALAAKNLHCEEAQIAKTLAFALKDKYILIVTAGDVKIDNTKYRDEFKEKARMIPKENVKEIIGHPVGGVCPFAVNKKVEIYLDTSLKRFKNVFPACGNDHNAIEITIEELEKTTNYKKWINVCH